VNLTVLSSGHVARRTIKVPHGEVFKGLNLLVESAALSAEGDTRSIKPDVLGDDFTTLIDTEGVLVLTLKVSVFEVWHAKEFKLFNFNKVSTEFGRIKLLLDDIILV
jgi:hypothetical protein